jgi:hypothetical protein
MNKFVNLGKRGVTLPPGCKDLIDVLQKPKPHAALASPHSCAGGLQDVAAHLSRLFEPAAKPRTLVITWHETNYLQVMRIAGVLTALAVVHEHTHREQAICQWFNAAGLAPTLDEAAAGFSVRVLGYPLPDSAAKVKHLLSDLLRTGYGLPENVALQFGCWENEPP